MMKKVVTAVTVYVLYLMVGAAIFVSLEQPAEQKRCAAAKMKMQNELTDFGNLYFYQLGLNRKLCNGINVVKD